MEIIKGHYKGCDIIKCLGESKTRIHLHIIYVSGLSRTVWLSKSSIKK